MALDIILYRYMQGTGYALGLRKPGIPSCSRASRRPHNAGEALYLRLTV